MEKPLISASILAADFAELKNEIQAVCAAGADMLHLDIMDGNFVPNITFGCDLIKSIKPHTKIPLDAHLMISSPEKHIAAFAEAGCDIITIHAEAAKHIDRAIDQIHSCGKKAGLALNPSTHESVLEYVLEKLDHVLIMTVNPGFYGQQFIAAQLPKIANVRKMINRQQHNVMLAVDGGLDKNSAKQCRAAGANVIVAAKAIFTAAEYRAAIMELRGEVDEDSRL